MKQEKILELLKEASVTTVELRKNQIQCEFQNAAPVHIPERHSDLTEEEHQYETGRCDETRNIIGRLFTETLMASPATLPSLFPFFALCCGDREENIISADVEWALFHG